jgi:hypothetical protein
MIWTRQRQPGIPVFGEVCDGTVVFNLVTQDGHSTVDRLVELVQT